MQYSSFDFGVVDSTQITNTPNSTTTIQEKKKQLWGLTTNPMKIRYLEYKFLKHK